MESLGLAITLVALVSGKYDTRQGNEFPYVVSIHRDGDVRTFLCAGSLLTTRWVLTTAHCLTKTASKIRYSNSSSPQNYNYSIILQRIRHMNARSLYPVLATSNPLTPKANNIGLALVEEVPHDSCGRLSGLDYFALLGHEVNFVEFNFNTMLKSRVYQSKKRQILNLERKRIPKGIKGNKGFGHKVKPTVRPKYVKPHGPNVNESIPISNTGYKIGTGVVMMCEDHDFPGPTICVAQKCIGSRRSTDMLFTLPDYGAPLLHDSRIVGVTTEADDSYSMYTPVSPYLDWIQAVIEGDIF